MYRQLPATGRIVLLIYTTMAVANVLLEFGDHRLLSTATKATLMPLLAGVLLASTPKCTPLVRATALALGASWLGDLALTGDGDVWFLAGLGCFLVAQLLYISGFAPWAARGRLRRTPALALPYLAWWAGLLVVLAPDVGGMLVPVAVYGLALVTMAALATGVGRLTAIGAALFVVSDSVIAVTSFTDRFDVPAAGAVIMATYTLGQALIVLGVLGAVRAAARAASVGARS